MHPFTEAINAKDLAPIVLAHRGQFDETRAINPIIRFFETKTRKRISLASMVLAAVLAGYAVTMSGNAIRMVWMDRQAQEQTR